MTDRDRLIELIKHARNDWQISTMMPAKYTFDSWIADHLLANGVVVPPCKVGDTVYEVQPIRKRIQAYEVTTIKYNGHFWWVTWILKDRKGFYGNVEGFSSNQLGKTVFLTKEEAEEKLKEFGNE